jgi:hypothetical protein
VIDNKQTIITGDYIFPELISTDEPGDSPTESNIPVCPKESE